MLTASRRFLIAAALLATPFVFAAEDPPSTTLTVEQAPGDLGEIRSKGALLIAADSKSKEVYIFDVAAKTLTRYRENGERWDDPVKLTELPLGPPQVLRVGGPGVGLLTPFGIAVYGIDGNREGKRDISIPADLLSLKSGWALSLVNLPIRSGQYLGRKEFGHETPRLITLTDDLETHRSGLYEDQEQRSGGASNGRALHLAAAGSRIYAVERGSYRVYEMGPKLTTLATFTEPKWAGEDAGEAEPTEAPQEILDQVQAHLASAGSELSGTTKKRPMPGPPIGRDLTFHYAVRAATWLGDLNRLLILRDRGIGDGERPELDLLDPVTGEGRSYSLAGVGDVEILQLTVGHRWIWLRSRRGYDPTWRISKLDLFEGGKPFQVPEVRRFGEEDPP